MAAIVSNLCRQTYPRWNTEGKWIDTDLKGGLVGKLNAVMGTPSLELAIEEESVVMEVINVLRSTLDQGLPGDIVEFGAGQG